MIKAIQIKTRGFEFESSSLGNVNILYGQNGAGKSTVINSITDLLKGKTDNKDLNMTLTLDDDIIITAKKGAISNSVGLGKDIEMQITGNFMNKEVAGINKTKEEKRNTIFNILGLNKEEFYKSKGIDFDIKGLRSQIKELDAQSKVLAQQLIEKKKELKELVGVEKPKEVVLVQGNEEQINYVKQTITRIENEIKEKQNTLTQLNKIKEVKLVKTEVIKGNEDIRNNLAIELNTLKERGEQLKKDLEVFKSGQCPTCKQAYVDNDKITSLENELTDLRNKYIDKDKELKSIEVIETKTIQGNELEHSEYITAIQMKERLTNEINKLQVDLDTEKQKVEGVDIVVSNVDEYNEYNIKQQQFLLYKNNKNNLENIISDLEKRIKDSSSVELQLKIDAYKEAEKEFINLVESKSQLDKDTKFIFFTKLKTPNSDGDEYKTDFDIEYKGKLYSQCSAGEKVYIDILIAKIFIEYNNVLDFIVIDNAEISDENLNQIIDTSLKGLQVFATRIAKGELRINQN